MNRRRAWIGMICVLVLASSAAEAADTREEEKIITEEWDSRMVEASCDGCVAAEEGSLIREKAVVPEVNALVDVKNIFRPHGIPESVRVTLTGTFHLRDALDFIAVQAGRHAVFGEGVENKELRLALDGVEWRRALRIILYPFEYGFKVDGRELVVKSRETRVFRLLLPPIGQAFKNVTTNESMSSSDGSGVSATGERGGRLRVGARIMVENGVEGLSYWDDIDKNARALLSPAGTISFNRSGGVMVASDTPVALDRLEVFINEVNERLSKQILVDVKVIEVELSREHQLGIDWSVLATHGELKAFGLSSAFMPSEAGTAGYLTLAARANKPGSGETESGVNALLRALDAFGQVEVVSQPRVAMLNNTVANIQAGQTRSYIESSSVETTQSGSISTAALNEVHGGVALQIVGNIVGEDIYLNVTPVVSSVDDIRSVSLGGGARVEAPETSMKSMSALVRLKEGHTAVIGGLITHGQNRRHTGVPVLGHLPLIGKLFSYEVTAHKKTELVIFITPRKG